MTAPRPWSPVRMPAFWLLLAVTAIVGLAALGLIAVLLFLAPRATAVVVALSVLYGAGWVLALLWLGDPVERRRFWLVGSALAWGATGAAAVGIGSGYFLDQVIAKAISPTFAAVWGAAFVGPTAEEAAKAAAVVLLFLAARPYLSTVWSGAVYGALAGVGFATVEDIAYGASYADEALPDDVRLGASVVLLRFVVPGLIGHAAFSAVAGAGVAYAWLRTDRSPGRRLAVLAGAFGSAWLMHFAVNSPVAGWAAEMLAEFPLASPFAGYFLVITAPAVPALAWLLRVRRSDALAVLARTAAAFPAAVRPAEVDVLAGFRTRRRAVRAAARGAGPHPAHALARLHRCQLRLAAAMVRPVRGYGMPPVLRWAREAEAARLAAPGLPGSVEPGSGAPALVTPGAVAPGPVGPAQVVPGSVVPGSVVAGVVAPGSVVAGAVAPGWAWPFLATAVAGLVFWPLALAALVGAGLALAVRGRRGWTGWPLTAAGWIAAYGTYVAAVSLLVTVLFS